LNACVLALALLPPRAGPAAGQAVTIWKGHKHTITCLAYAPDGKTLASGAKDGEAILWDVAGGRPRAVLAGHKDMVTALAFAPDGRTLASASHDADILLWDAAGRRLRALRGHDRDVRDRPFQGS
jgi:WD40 repeat protein